MHFCAYKTTPSFVCVDSCARSISFVMIFRRTWADFSLWIGDHRPATGRDCIELFDKTRQTLHEANCDDDCNSDPEHVICSRQWSDFVLTPHLAWPCAGLASNDLSCRRFAAPQMYRKIDVGKEDKESPRFCISFL
jgi:hypothetical protein